MVYWWRISRSSAREVARLTGSLQAVVAHLQAERRAGRPLDPSVTAGEDAQ